MTTPVFDIYDPKFISGDWIYAQLRAHRLAPQLGLADQIMASEFLDGLDVNKVRPYVLLGSLDLTHHMRRKPARVRFLFRVTERLLMIFERDDVKHLLAINDRGACE